MRRRATYGQRSKIVYVMIVLASLAFYQRGIRPLTMKVKATAAMENTLLQAGTGDDLEALEARMSELDRALGDTMLDADRVQHDLLEHIGSACRQHGTELVALAPGERRTSGDHAIVTEWITLSGGFHGLVRTIDAMERWNASPSRIASLDLFARERNFGEQRELHATICFQSVLRTH